MQRNQTIVWMTLLITLFLVVFIFMLSPPPSWQLSIPEFHVRLAANVIMACLHIGAAVLFTMNLSVYTPKFRNTYIAIAVGIVITGLGTLQVSIVAIFDAWYSPWVLSGGMIAPFLVATLTSYLAIRYLARLVGLKHILTRALLVLPLTFALSVLTSLLPHVAVNIPEIAFSIGIGVTVWAACLLFIAGLLVLDIRHHAGSHYTNAMTWLARALFVGFLILTIQTIYTLISVDENHILIRVLNVLGVSSGILWLCASYAFALTKDYKEGMPLLRSLFGKITSNDMHHSKTVVEMVTYTAGLVSNSDDIDPLLDNVRGITAKLKPGEKPSADDTQSLVATYLKIEHYLVTKEVVRNYTQSELRARLDPRLVKMLG